MKIEPVILDGGRARNERSTSSTIVVVVLLLVLLVRNIGAILVTRPLRCVCGWALRNAEDHALPFIVLAYIGIHCPA